MRAERKRFREAAQDWRRPPVLRRKEEFRQKLIDVNSQFKVFISNADASSFLVSACRQYIDVVSRLQDSHADMLRYTDEFPAVPADSLPKTGIPPGENVEKEGETRVDVRTASDNKTTPKLGQPAPFRATARGRTSFSVHGPRVHGGKAQPGTKEKVEGRKPSENTVDQGREQQVEVQHFLDKKTTHVSSQPALLQASRSVSYGYGTQAMENPIVGNGHIEKCLGNGSSHRDTVDQGSEAAIPCALNNKTMPVSSQQALSHSMTCGIPSAFGYAPPVVENLGVLISGSKKEQSLGNGNPHQPTGVRKPHIQAEVPTVLEKKAMPTSSQPALFQCIPAGRTVVFGHGASPLENPSVANGWSQEGEFEKYSNVFRGTADKPDDTCVEAPIAKDGQTTPMGSQSAVFSSRISRTSLFSGNGVANVDDRRGCSNTEEYIGNGTFHGGSVHQEVEVHVEVPVALDNRTMPAWSQPEHSHSMPCGTSIISGRRVPVVENPDVGQGPDKKEESLWNGNVDGKTGNQRSQVQMEVRTGWEHQITPTSSHTTLLPSNASGKSLFAGHDASIVENPAVANGHSESRWSGMPREEIVSQEGEQCEEVQANLGHKTMPISSQPSPFLYTSFGGSKVSVHGAPTAEDPNIGKGHNKIEESFVGGHLDGKTEDWSGRVEGEVQAGVDNTTMPMSGQLPPFNSMLSRMYSVSGHGAPVVENHVGQDGGNGHSEVQETPRNNFGAIPRRFETDSSSSDSLGDSPPLQLPRCWGFSSPDSSPVPRSRHRVSREKPSLRPIRTSAAPTQTPVAPPAAPTLTPIRTHVGSPVQSQPTKEHESPPQEHSSHARVHRNPDLGLSLAGLYRSKEDEDNKWMNGSRAKKSHGKGKQWSCTRSMR